MILVRKLRLAPGEDASALRARAAKKLRLPCAEVKELTLIKRSLDARHKDDIHYVCSAALSVSGDERRVIARVKSPDVCEYTPPEYSVARVSPGEGAPRPVIAGFGPAGMFAALDNYRPRSITIGRAR